MTEQQAIAIARETVASMAEREKWGAPVEDLRAGRRDSDLRIRIAAQAVMDACG